MDKPKVTALHRAHDQGEFIPLINPRQSVSIEVHERSDPLNLSKRREMCFALIISSCPEGPSKKIIKIAKDDLVFYRFAISLVIIFLSAERIHKLAPLGRIGLRTY